MTVVAAIALLVLAFLDGAFSGFRSSVGRTGLIDHRESDHHAVRRDAALVCVLLVPVIALVSSDVLLRHRQLAAFTRAGEAMLAIYAPYALLVLTALACYAALGWRQRYVASALILGPFTLVRPAVAAAGGVLGAVVGHDAIIAASAGLSVVAVLAVEPFGPPLVCTTPWGKRLVAKRI